MKGVYRARWIGNVLVMLVAVTLVAGMLHLLGEAMSQSTSWLVSDVAW